MMKNINCKDAMYIALHRVCARRAEKIAACEYGPNWDDAYTLCLGNEDWASGVAAAMNEAYGFNPTPACEYPALDVADVLDVLQTHEALCATQLSNF